MLMSLLSHVLSAYFCFILPSYSTFKALSHRPLSENDLVRWSMYWSVVGACIAFEYIAEWFISWLPFYWEIKTIFLLFLALPQTEGSTYIYQTYLQPFFSRNEADLDAGILRVQSNTLEFIQARLASLWDIVIKLLTKNDAGQRPSGNGQPTQPAPTAGQGLNLETAMGLWNKYGSSVMGALQRGQAPAATPPRDEPASRPAAASTSSYSSYSGASNLERRGPATPGFDLPTPNQPIGTPSGATPTASPPAFPTPEPRY